MGRIALGYGWIAMKKDCRDVRLVAVEFRSAPLCCPRVEGVEGPTTCTGTSWWKMKASQSEVTREIGLRGGQTGGAPVVSDVRAIA